MKLTKAFDGDDGVKSDLSHTLLLFIYFVFYSLLIAKFFDSPKFTIVKNAKKIKSKIAKLDTYNTIFYIFSYLLTVKSCSTHLN